MNSYERSSCGQAAQRACALECSEDDDCDALGRDARCDAGRCLRPAAPIGGQGGQQGGQGGQGGSGGAGASGTSGSGGGNGDAGACAPMNAVWDGSECLSLLGFAFDGSTCRDIQCGCNGDDCDALFPSLRACERAYSECVTVSCAQMDARSAGTLCAGIAGYSWNGADCNEVLCTCAGDDCDAIYASEFECIDAHRACEHLTMCTKPSDCVLASTLACSCQELTSRDVVAISAYSQRALDARMLEVGQACPECEDNPYAAVATRFLPQCVSATQWEGGQCTLLDTTRLSCTPEVGCRVRARTCCECNADVSIANLMAIPSGGDDAYSALCEPGQACPECEALYPDNVEARCSDAGFCELLADGSVVEP